MNKIKEIILVSACLPFIALSAQSSEKSCELESFLSTYGALEKYETMLELEKFSETHTIENEDIIEADLAKRYEEFMTEALSHQGVLQILQALTQEELSPLYEILSNVGSEFSVGRDEINLNINTTNVDTRDIKIAAFKESIINKYQSSFEVAVDEVATLSERHKAHLKTWAFEFIIEDPGYAWGDSADQLLSYLSDLKFTFFKQTAGRLVYGPYYLEYQFAQFEPALNLNMVMRPDPRQENSKDLKPMNLIVSFEAFAPKGERVSVQVCDFSVGENPNACKNLDFYEWCKL